MGGKEGEGQPELQPPLALAGGVREGRLLARPYTLRVVQAVTEAPLPHALPREAVRRPPRSPFAGQRRGEGGALPAARSRGGAGRWGEEAEEDWVFGWGM
jgi:hypothetical protein